MILELDAGNSSIKYRVLALSDARVLLRGRLRGVSELAAWLEKEGRTYAASRASMVHSARALELPLHETMEPYTVQKLCIAKVSEQLAGVRHAYADPGQLGVDRWLAMGAAYHLVGGACLVIDAGTAITADTVDASGMHLGGCIAPGVERLIGSLITGTTLQAGRAETVSGLQRTTESCVDAGINLMLEGFVTQLKGIADQEMPKGYRVVVTGGDARRLLRHLPEATLVDELVFDGLALACPVRV